MSLEKDLEVKVEAVLHANTVQRATEIIRSRFGTSILAVISFVEAALPLPLLTDPFLIAAVLLDRTRTVRLVLVTTLASAVGGVVAYVMALFFLEHLLDLMSPGVVEQFNILVDGNDSSTLMLTLVGAITPVPYTIVAWVVAVLQGSLAVFILGSVLGRGFRFAIVGYSTYRFGPLAVSYAKRYLGITSLIVLVIAILYFVFFI